LRKGGEEEEGNRELLEEDFEVVAFEESVCILNLVFKNPSRCSGKFLDKTAFVVFTRRIKATGHLEGKVGKQFRDLKLFTKSSDPEPPLSL